MCAHGLNVGARMIGAASRDEHLLRLAEALELGGYAPRIHVVVGGEQLRALIDLLAPLATASRRGVGVRWCTERENSTAAVGFHFGGRPHKRNYSFVLTSLHQRSGVDGWKGRPRRWQRSAGWYQFFFFAGTRRSLGPYTKTKIIFPH